MKEGQVYVWRCGRCERVLTWEDATGLRCPVSTPRGPYCPLPPKGPGGWRPASDLHRDHAVVPSVNSP
jgi:hypothetical protein